MSLTPQKAHIYSEKASREIMDILRQNNCYLSVEKHTNKVSVCCDAINDNVARYEIESPKK